MLIKGMMKLLHVIVMPPFFPELNDCLLLFWALEEIEVNIITLCTVTLDHLRNSNKLIFLSLYLRLSRWENNQKILLHS